MKGSTCERDCIYRELYWEFLHWILPRTVINNFYKHFQNNTTHKPLTIFLPLSLASQLGYIIRLMCILSNRLCFWVMASTLFEDWVSG